jgi:hypothetical protein
MQRRSLYLIGTQSCFTDLPLHGVLVRLRRMLLQLCLMIDIRATLAAPHIDYYQNTLKFDRPAVARSACPPEADAPATYFWWEYHLVDEFRKFSVTT